MQQKIEFSSPSFTWVDVIAPTREELEALAAVYRLHPSSVQDCLDPEHLPKFEKIGDTNFLIVRTFDESCNIEGDDVQELTRKISCFYTENFLLTVHRQDHPFVAQMRKKWLARDQSIKPTEPAPPLPALLYELLMGAFQSYEHPVDAGLNELEQLEMSVFGAHGSQPFQIENGYYLKRRASVFKRTLRLTMDQIPKVGASVPMAPTNAQNLREEGDSLLFYADELLENINTLLNLHISLSSQKVNEASHRTGEVVRVLTIFSVFLLPLNLITGIYGMNFKHIPELEWYYGFPMAIGLMVIIGIAIYFWFNRKGWLMK